eukprot:TRINITY_DN15944_c0_g1_i1.p1 TRINITY_DN15944_c0_g1~~TRINITY_DN15944_c0_g1_i1.p1  ORF type:complete len:323 (+),score=69.31 TRINITY_DN15944_c0_g1_i1:979-1947(+)
MATPPANASATGTKRSRSGAPSGKDEAKWTRFPVRTRPHRNPLSDDLNVDHPVKPADVPLHEYYPEGAYTPGKKIEFLDIGCAYGGLLVNLAPLHPDTLMLGMEIRAKVAHYTQSRINRLRHPDANAPELQRPDDDDDDEEEAVEMEEGAEGTEHPARFITRFTITDPQAEGAAAEGANAGAGYLCPSAASHHYNNVWVVRSNAMKYLPNYICKGQLQKLFFCYPDPHFKKRTHKRRIISPGLVPEYTYVVAPGGRIYVITDVQDLYEWMTTHLAASPLLERLSQEETDADPMIPLIRNRTEDAQRAERKKCSKYYAIFVRK